MLERLDPEAHHPGRLPSPIPALALGGGWRGRAAGEHWGAYFRAASPMRRGSESW
jgi:hypothetical protein